MTYPYRSPSNPKLERRQQQQEYTERIRELHDKARENLIKLADLAGEMPFAWEMLYDFFHDKTISSAFCKAMFGRGLGDEIPHYDCFKKK